MAEMVEFPGMNPQKDPILRGYFFKAPPSSGFANQDSLCPTVILTHGYFGFSCCRFLLQQAMGYQTMGLNVLLFDYESYGISDGFPRHDIHLGRFSNNWEAAMTYVNGRHDVAKNKIVLVGCMISSILIIELLAIKKDPRICLCMIHLSFFDLDLPVSIRLGVQNIYSGLSKGFGTVAVWDKFKEIICRHPRTDPKYYSDAHYYSIVEPTGLKDFSKAALLKTNDVYNLSRLCVYFSSKNELSAWKRHINNRRKDSALDINGFSSMNPTDEILQIESLIECERNSDLVDDQIFNTIYSYWNRMTARSEANLIGSVLFKLFHPSKRNHKLIHTIENIPVLIQTMSDDVYLSNSEFNNVKESCNKRGRSNIVFKTYHGDFLAQFDAISYMRGSCVMNEKYHDQFLFLQHHLGRKL